MRADESQAIDAATHRSLLTRAAAGAARGTLDTPVPELLRTTYDPLGQPS